MTSLNSWHERPRKEKIPPPGDSIFRSGPGRPGWNPLLPLFSLYFFYYLLASEEKKIKVRLTQTESVCFIGSGASKR